MLIILICWLAIVFMSAGLFAPPNATVIVALMLAALSVSGAIFLILELDMPFDGIIQISPGAHAQRVNSSRALTPSEQMSNENDQVGASHSRPNRRDP